MFRPLRCRYADCWVFNYDKRGALGVGFGHSRYLKMNMTANVAARHCVIRSAAIYKAVFAASAETGTRSSVIEPSQVS